MKPGNLISICEGSQVLEQLAPNRPRKYRVLKSHEIDTLRSLCGIMRDQGCRMPDFDGFYVGYTIPQISKEFDLLRLGSNLSLNIEMKSPLVELTPEQQQNKILRQMRKNFYYLKILEAPVVIFTYVQQDGFYQYDRDTDSLHRAGAAQVVDCIRRQQVDHSQDPEQIFVPSHYLISPFSDPDRFLENDYFLTSAQQEIKRSVMAVLHRGQFACFTISADAGTGKTLLLYDIARTVLEQGQRPVILHGGQLNRGQNRLNSHLGWCILSVRQLNQSWAKEQLERCSIFLVDEAHRFRPFQLRILMDAARRQSSPVVFCYDVKQALHRYENNDIRSFLELSYPGIAVYPHTLKTRLRTRPEMASFIDRMQDLGQPLPSMPCDCISIEYMDRDSDLKSYLDFLRTEGWTPLTYTLTNCKNDPYAQLAALGGKRAQSVIGQEFSRVVVVMDEHFRYDANGRLTAAKGVYDAAGMLYQMVTRAVDELKIVVTRNPVLYAQLLRLKTMSQERG